MKWDPRSRRVATAAVAVLTLGVFAVVWSPPEGQTPLASGRTPRIGVPAAPVVPSIEPVAPAGDDAGLEARVHATLEENARLSRYVLWHNTIPTWAPASTRGPALESLRRAATARTEQGLRVRVDEHSPEVLELDPGTEEVVAVVRITSRATVHRDGQPTGDPRTASETVRMTLRRVDGGSLVVWEVTPVASAEGGDGATTAVDVGEDPGDGSSPTPTGPTTDAPSPRQPDGGSQVSNNNNNNNNGGGSQGGAGATTSSDDCSATASAGSGGSSASTCSGGG